MAQELTPLNAPWYRHVWVWLLMIPPAGAVLGGVATAWLAGGPPALVVDDYGEIAMATEQRRARDMRAYELGLSATLERLDAFATQPGGLQLRLHGGPDFRQPPRLQLQLIHPTLKEQDRTLLLEREAGQYAGPMPEQGNRMYLQLADPESDWRLVGEMFPDTASTPLAPAPGTGAAR